MLRVLSSTSARADSRSLRDSGESPQVGRRLIRTLASRRRGDRRDGPGSGRNQAIPLEVFSVPIRAGRSWDSSGPARTRAPRASERVARTFRPRTGFKSRVRVEQRHEHSRIVRPLALAVQDVPAVVCLKPDSNPVHRRRSSPRAIYSGTEVGRSRRCAWRMRRTSAPSDVSVTQKTAWHSVPTASALSAEAPNCWSAKRHAEW